MGRLKLALAVFMILAISASSAFAQYSDEAGKLYERYLQTQKQKSTHSSTEKYRSPDIYGDTLKQPHGMSDSLLTYEDSLAAGLYADNRQNTEKDTLRVFGYDMFTDESANFAPPEIATLPHDYAVGPGDNLIVNVWGRVDMELDLTVDREGKVFVPKVGEIICWGVTLPDLEKRFVDKMSKSYSGFELSVTLGKIRTIKVYVYGEVKKPGGYTLSSLSTLFNALYAARGPNGRGSMRKVRLIREGRTAKEVDLYKFLLMGDSSDDIKLESEDVVFVPLAEELVAVTGEVRRPGIYEMIGGERIDDVVALAGGSRPTAYLGRVMVDRVGDGDSRKLIDVDLTEKPSDGNFLAMRPGDLVTVFSIDEMHENAVCLDGYVKHPGSYEINERPSVYDLVFYGKQLYEDTYLDRADLIRATSDGTQQIISVNLREVLSGNSLANVKLQPKDSLVIYSSNDVGRKRYVTIRGEVEKPGEYRLYEGMKLTDLIFMSGNLKRSAFTLAAEIARINSEGRTELFHVNLKKLIEDKNEMFDVALAEDDQVFIRSIPEWDTDRIILLEGEVRFPGEYALSYKGESLYELIQRAGGLTEKAFPSGAIFSRQEISQQLERKSLADIISKSAPLREDSNGALKRDLFLEYKPEKMNRIVIDLPSIMSTRGERGNIMLRPGDEIYIPAVPSGVQVMGAVASSGTIQHIPGKKPKYYIERAGGFLKTADEGGTRVVKADGRVLSWGKAKGRRVDIGDAIVVPTEVKKSHDWWKIITSSATILGGLATTAYLIDRL